MLFSMTTRIYVYIYVKNKRFHLSKQCVYVCE
jgi:hypothetical protein